MITHSWILAARRTVILLACVTIASAAAAVSAPTPKSDALMTQLASIENLAHPYPWLWTGGQPDSKALATLADAGVRDVFDLRTASEPRGFDERKVAESLGLRYLPIPTGSPDFTDSKFTAIRHHLIAHGPSSPMFVHCASGNRVGAALLPWLVLDQGVEQNAALQIARSMGLKDQTMTDKALAYIHARQGSASSK